VITVPDTGAKKDTAPLSVKLSGLASVINYAFVLEGSPSPSDDVINGLVLTGMSEPLTGGLNITMTAKYTMHPSAQPLVPGFSDNHYRCVAPPACLARTLAALLGLAGCLC
jgi:hypothetical protein